MAVGGDTTYFAGSLFEQIASRAIVAFSDANVALPLTTQETAARAQKVAWNVINTDTNKITSADVNNVTDGVEISPTLLDSRKKTATLVRRAVRLDLYGDAKLSNLTALDSNLPVLVGNAMGAKIDALIAAELDNFSTSVGVSTIAMTVDNVFSAIQTAKTGGAIGMLSMLLSEKQVWGTNGILNDLVTTQQFGGSPATQQTALATGIIPPIGGVPTRVTREFTEGSNATKGGMFVPSAIGTGWAGPLIEVEFDSEPKFDRQMWFAFSFFDVAMLVDTWGAEIWTKTS